MSNGLTLELRHVIVVFASWMFTVGCNKADKQPAAAEPVVYEGMTQKQIDEEEKAIKKAIADWHEGETDTDVLDIRIGKCKLKTPEGLEIEADGQAAAAVSVSYGKGKKTDEKKLTMGKRNGVWSIVSESK